ncbi:multidrug DMT transporter [Deinococcus sp.]|uniref:multidrug DMT transporter n=1 Tax=Deinococcus sp. TaxID=47478 RepID=UPI0025C4CD4F|nr:multidrug DMT transporter [Deinococcus sp.]
MDTLKKAGLMTQHLELFHYMQELRGLLQLAAHMEERGDRAALIGAEQLTLIGQDTVGDASITTSKGATITAPVAYRLLAQLKGFEDEEYTVNRKELAALNARAVAELESSDALRAFADTLARIEALSGTAQGGGNQGSRGAAPVEHAAQSAHGRAPAEVPQSEIPAERPSRGRRASEETPSDQPAS